MTKNKYVAYVSTYTMGDNHGIKIYDVDMKNGRLKEKDEVEITNSSYITISHNEKYLYSITDFGVEAYVIEQDGELTCINHAPINGMRGCYLSTDYEDRFLFVAGYHDGKVTVVHTHKDGRLGSLMDGVFHKGLGSVAERNFRPHVSCVVPTPDNKYVCAVDNGIDQIKMYKLNTQRDRLKLVDILRCERESGPREIVFSESGKYAYVIYELMNKVDVFSYRDTGNGPEFEKLQSISTTSANVDQAHDAASGMCLSPDHHYLFTSTAGDNTVAMFHIDPETGCMEKKFALPISGEYPKDIAMFPDGKHIAVANHESNTITTFTVDYEKNVLVQKGRPMKVETPNCILITKKGVH